MDKNFRTIVEHSIQGIVIIQDFRVVYSNHAFAKISGYSKKELLSLTSAKLEKVIHPDHRDLVWGRMRSRLQGQKVTPRYEFKGIRKDGSIRWLEMVANRIKFEGKPAILGAIIDITDRKNTEKALRESEEKYRAIFESFHDVYYRTDREGLVTIISPSVRNHAGWDPEDIIGHPVTDFYKDPSEREAFKEKLKESGVINDYELKLLAKDGRVIDVSVSSKIIHGKDGRSIGVEGVLRDITDRKCVEEQVKSSLKEKEVLLQEIHHRVKNNMQIISSLLNLQSRNISDKKAKDMFKMSRDRIRSMALIHEKLYQSKDLSKINFAQYIQSLTLHLLHTYNANAKRIKLSAEVKDVFLDINKAIPCGLIVNELVSNSLKHAFPQNMKGNILVQLSAGDNGNIRLSVSDDGIGFAEGVDIQKPDSLGLQLVNDLIHQLGGTLELDLSRGTSYQISFFT